MSDHEPPIVEAEIVRVSDDTERRRLHTLARRRRAIFNEFYLDQPGTPRERAQRAYRIVETVAESPREHARLVALVGRLRGIAESCAPPPVDPAIDEPESEKEKGD